MGQPIIATGANSAYFLMTCLLMESVSKFAAAYKFVVLDFGLNEAERGYFQSKHVLIAPPGIPDISADAHPYYLKTMLGRYLQVADPTSPIIWIDGDIVLGRDIVASLNRVLSEMAESGAAVAACEECKISDILAFTEVNLEPFRTMLNASGVSAGAPYFNSGFVVFRSRQTLNDWAEIGRQTPFHGLFDQNLLNLLIHTGHKVAPLPADMWNLHGRLLDESTLNPRLNSGDIPYILHATSSLPDDFSTIFFSMERDFGVSYAIRLFSNSMLRSHQVALMDEFLSREFPQSRMAAI